MLPSRIFFDQFLDDFTKEDKMRCDIYEKEGIYHIEADIPGFNKEDINVEFSKGNLVITAEHTEEEHKDDDKKYLRRERTFYGKYQRSFYLGDVDETNIEASFNNGILEITIPKKPEESDKKMIEIK